MKKCLFPWISPPLLLPYLFKFFKKGKKKKKRWGKLLYLPSFRDSYSLIVTFMIQYCELHIMLKLNQTLDLCIGLVKQILWGSGAGRASHAGGSCTSTCQWSVALCSVLCVLLLSIYLFYINIILLVYETNKTSACKECSQMFESV